MEPEKKMFKTTMPLEFSFYAGGEPPSHQRTLPAGTKFQLTGEPAGGRCIVFLEDEKLLKQVASLAEADFNRFVEED